MKVRELLKTKSQDTETIEPDKSIKEAMDIIVAKRIGALPVLDKGELVGIITERDIFRLLHKNGAGAFTFKVGDVMTRKLVVGILEDDIEMVQAVMTNNRFRHLPIMDGRKMVGILSIGDIVKSHVKNLQIENRYLIDYITGKYPG